MSQATRTWLGNIFQFPRWLVRHPLAWFACWAAIAPLLFWTDHDLTAIMQLVPALFVWWMLLGALTSRSRSDRVLIGVLVVVATGCEVLGSLILHWYSYRLHNIPPWVPPGHGIVFLTALLAAEQPRAIKYAAPLRNLVSIGMLIYASYGIGRYRDITGAIFGLLFLTWLWSTGPQKGRFYAALWVCVCSMELCGVWLGAWRWGASMPLVHLPENNPPSGIVGAYGIFDLAAFAIAWFFTHQTSKLSFKSLSKSL